MNRKQRRAAAERPTGRPRGRSVQDMFADAIRHHRAGRLGEAERHYRQILAVAPRHADSLHLLGVTALQSGRFDLAADLIGNALAVKPDDPEALSNLGNALICCSRMDEAEASYRKALDLKPNYPEAHMNLGNALGQQGRLQEAAASYRRALGDRPDYVEALVNLGNVLEDLDERDEAIALYRKALVVEPDLAEAHNNLGAALYPRGLLDEAIASYRRALEIRPNFVMALDNLASALMAQGDPEAALSIARRSLEIEETDDAKGNFVSCLGRAQGSPPDKALQPLVVRALSQAWGRTGDLTRVCIDLVKLDDTIAACLARAVAAWPNVLPSGPLFGPNGLAALTANPLLSALLDAGPICDVEMERFLTMARRALLDSVGDGNGSMDRICFYSALARQCFINEYVYCVMADEQRKIDDLRRRLVAALATDGPVPVSWLVAVAAYVPLHSLQYADRLLERAWPEEIIILLTQQVREPAEERRIAATVPQLTGIEDDVSRLVRSQYEENPYPRWVKVPRSRKADSILAYLRRTFSLAAFDRSAPNGAGSGDRMEILVAGCGTGQQSIRTAQQFPTARILAIDLSRSSLAYAARKTRELGISTIEYAQADLLKLGSLDRRFDAIEASGVLHHLADPWLGWRMLLPLLRPGGFMLLGLYSDTARREVVRTRGFIAAQGYGQTADEIRRCRQDLVDQGSVVGPLSGTPSDLFTLSGCRDALFHVQEHRTTLTEIERFLGQNNLTFLGFEISPDIRQFYRERFPEDHAATDLSQWQIFENENPDTFAGMYQFWIQKE